MSPLPGGGPIWHVPAWLGLGVRFRVRIISINFRGKKWGLGLQFGVIGLDNKGKVTEYSSLQLASLLWELSYHMHHTVLPPDIPARVRIRSVWG